MMFLVSKSSKNFRLRRANDAILLNIQVHVHVFAISVAGEKNWENPRTRKPPPLIEYRSEYRGGAFLSGIVLILRDLDEKLDGVPIFNII